jgi:DNA-binding XRE family transcriptional regulator
MANHPLREYRDQHEITLQDMARKADTTAGSLSRIETWQQTPSLALVARLIKASRGALSADDFLERA